MLRKPAFRRAIVDDVGASHGEAEHVVGPLPIHAQAGQPVAHLGAVVESLRKLLPHRILPGEESGPVDLHGRRGEAVCGTGGVRRKECDDEDDGSRSRPVFGGAADYILHLESLSCA